MPRGKPRTEFKAEPVRLVRQPAHSIRPVAQDLRIAIEIAPRRAFKPRRFGSKNGLGLAEAKRAGIVASR